MRWLEDKNKPLKARFTGQLARTNRTLGHQPQTNRTLFTDMILIQDIDLRCILYIQHATGFI